MKGFTFPYGRKEVFVATDRKNKTKALASEILRKMQLPDNPDIQKDLLYYLQKVDGEKKTLGNGTEWISMKGDNFSAFMPLDDAIIIELD